MTNYNHSDFMPKETSDHGLNEEVDAMTEIDSQALIETETVSIPENCPEIKKDPEIGIISSDAEPVKWAQYVSLFFAPVLISTYCVALTMWITPLSLISENTRLGVSLVILLVTAMIPTVFKLTISRLYLKRNNHKWISPVVNGLVLAFCQGCGAFYLMAVHAPIWLVTILIAGAEVTIVYLFVRLFVRLSSYMTAMGAMVAVIFYLSRTNIIDVISTPWIIGLIILSGLVGSARLALYKVSLKSLSLGFVIGSAIAYLMMNIGTWGIVFTSISDI